MCTFVIRLMAVSHDMIANHLCDSSDQVILCTQPISITMVLSFVITCNMTQTENHPPKCQTCISQNT